MKYNQKSIIKAIYNLDDLHKYEQEYFKKNGFKLYGGLKACVFQNPKKTKSILSKQHSTVA